MKRTPRGRAGFSLTEILMAVGILGVGLTMVATVFPVAVDQSRRSTDTTMAALCARSTAALLRARRANVSIWCRNNAMLKTAYMDISALPQALAQYNPNMFLYDPMPCASTNNSANKQPRQYKDAEMWNAGNYVAVVFATPIQYPLSSPAAGYGPWRITIAVFKSPTGRTPDLLSTTNNAKYLKEWGKNPTPPGGYILDSPPFVLTSAPNNFRGQAYLIDNVKITGSTTGIVLAVSKTDVVPSTGPLSALPPDGNTTLGAGWIGLPGAIAVYHTVLGE